MTKGQMKEVLEKTEVLEKILMRDLEEKEITYLVDHSVNDFLFDVLGFDKDDLLVLKKIKKVISDWCTKPEESLDSIREDANLFFEDNEFENETGDVNFFKETTNRINRKVSDVLSNILSDLEKEKRNFVAKKEGEDKLKVTSNSEKPKDFDFGEEEINEAIASEIQEIDPISIMNMIPDCAKKWVVNLTQNEISKAVDKATEILSDEYLKTHTDYELYPETDYYKKHGLVSILVKPESIKLDEDEVASEIVDQIKNVAIKHYVSIIEKEGEFEFNDSEIQSEVLDYLYKNNYKVKSIDNKVNLV